MLVGEKMEDYMDVERVDSAYRAYFGDYMMFDLLYDIEVMCK